MAPRADRMAGSRRRTGCARRAEEMMATLIRTAYSPNIKERRDCSVGIFDAKGQLLALTAIAPLHLLLAARRGGARHAPLPAGDAPGPATASWPMIPTMAAGRTCRT